jgi:hypothetical protein
MKDIYKKSIDEEDIINICDEPEKKHRRIAHIVYRQEIDKIKTLSIREKDVSIYERYIISKYNAVCQMMESMYNYIYYYGHKKNKEWIFKKYMKHDNPADWIEKSNRPIDHYIIIFTEVYNNYEIDSKKRALVYDFDIIKDTSFSG